MHVVCKNKNLDQNPPVHRTRPFLEGHNTILPWTFREIGLAALPLFYRLASLPRAKLEQVTLPNTAVPQGVTA